MPYIRLAGYAVLPSIQESAVITRTKRKPPLCWNTETARRWKVN